MRRILTTIVVTALFTLGMRSTAFAESPHFISASATGVASNGTLSVTFKEAGLGNQITNVQVTLSGQGSANYACINGGGKHPSATNKETVNGPVSSGGSFPVRNGSTSGTLTLSPPSAGSFSCPSGQSLVLAAVSYTGVSLSGAGATASIAGTFSACLQPGIGIC
jgi:hypothetical protein